jgi:UDP-sulfoquinovose synthase
MRVLILGGDGYLGWPTAMAFANSGNTVLAIDNYARRRLAKETNSEALCENPVLPERAALYEAATGQRIETKIGDCADHEFLSDAVRNFMPDTVVHFAEQPSAPYSMMSAATGRYTLSNNLMTTFNVLVAIRDVVPDAQLIKLGTMGAYGTPNIDIEEGWIDIEVAGRRDRFLYPRQGGSLYHTSKVMDTDLIWLFVRTHKLRVTDLMQGPVYGLVTLETRGREHLFPNFHYDDIFGTVLNRFVVQAVAGVPLTVYGKGNQVRGYINLMDVLQCVDLAARRPANAGELRIFNQFTETFSVNDLASRVRGVGAQRGIDVAIRSLPNPRIEKEEHYYNPKSSGLANLGLRPHLLTDEVLGDMMDLIQRHRERIDTGKIHPRVSWNP